MPRRSYEDLRRETRMRFAQNIKAERERRGLTQEKAAELVGFSLQYLQRIERGIVNVPMDTIARFAFAYKETPAKLLA